MLNEIEMKNLNNIVRGGILPALDAIRINKQKLVTRVVYNDCKVVS